MKERFDYSAEDFVWKGQALVLFRSSGVGLSKAFLALICLSGLPASSTVQHLLQNKYAFLSRIVAYSSALT